MDKLGINAIVEEIGAAEAVRTASARLSQNNTLEEMHGVIAVLTHYWKPARLGAFSEFFELDLHVKTVLKVTDGLA